MSLTEFTPTPVINPGNENKILCIPIKHDICIDGTSENVFYLPIELKGLIRNFLVRYKQGFDNIQTSTLVKIEGEDCVKTETDKYIKISVNLSRENTRLFKDTLLDTFADVRMETTDNRVLFTCPCKMNIIEPVVQTPDNN